MLEDAVPLQRPMPLPEARGPVSDAALGALRGTPGPLAEVVRDGLAGSNGILDDEDLQLALFLLYEQHYGGLAGVDERLEWDVALLAARAEIETAFEAALRAAVPMPERPEPTAAAVAAALFALTGRDDGPSLSRYVAKTATLQQLREFLVQRSLYTLKEADPHSWAIPRLSATAKAALVEIQADEYGGGRPQRMHSAIFAGTMRAVGLDDAYGAYLDAIPGTTLATVNLMSLLGLHRRLRGGIVGHLAVFEITSPEPNRRYGNGLRRLGFDRAATEFFDEHVEADAVHEAVAAHDLAQGLAVAEPELVPDILFGAAALLHLEARFAAHMLDRWAAGSSSLRPC